jgi:FtsH-binding integral membrane protein
MSLSVVAAAAGAFILSFAWYTIFSRRLAALSSVYATEARPSGAVIALEFVRSLIVAGVLAALAVATEADTWAAGAALGLLAWIGFPLVILSGSVLHEKYPAPLAAIHIGDWLLKLLLIAGVVAAWR